MNPKLCVAFLVLFTACSAQQSGDGIVNGPNGPRLRTPEERAQDDARQTEADQRRREERRVKVGTRSPEFTRPSVLDRKTSVRLPATNKVTILHFWATWSEPDKKATPKLAAIHLRHANEALEIIGVSLDDEEKDVAEAAREWGANYSIVWDQGHDIAARYEPPGEPTLYVVDRHGIVRFIHIGYHDAEEKTIELEAVQLLNEETSSSHPSKK